LAEQEAVMMRWLLVLLVAFSTTASAQPKDRREKIKERIRALRAYTLTAELQLDEATAGKLFPALAKYDAEFDKLLQQRLDIQRRLDGASRLADPKAIDKVIDEAVANQRALWDTEDKRLAQLRKILTPAQTARVLIVLPALERKIQNQLRKAVQRQMRQQQRRGGAPFDEPVDPYDDDEEELGVNPFQGPQQKAAPKRPAPKPAAPKPVPPGTKPCDPFASVAGCP
jgi:hypothetical protein